MLLRIETEVTCSSGKPRGGKCKPSMLIDEVDDAVVLVVDDLLLVVAVPVREVLPGGRMEATSGDIVDVVGKTKDIRIKESVCQQRRCRLFMVICCCSAILGICHDGLVGSPSRHVWIGCDMREEEDIRFPRCFMISNISNPTAE